MAGTDDEVGYEAARTMAAATGGGKALLAEVQWRSRAAPGMLLILPKIMDVW